MLDGALQRLDDLVERLPAPWREACLGGLLLFPAGLVLFLFGLLPIGYAVFLSIRPDQAGPGPWVAWENYQQALQSPAFWNSFRVSLYYCVGTIPCSLLLSLLVAWGLFQVRHIRGFLRTCYFLPYVTSLVAAAMVWRALYNPQGGVLNQCLDLAGLERQQWLLEPRGMLHLITGGLVPPAVGPSLALCCIMLFDIWHSSGFSVVVLLAGFTAVPRELEEAARMDGAGAWKSFCHVSLPFLSPALSVLMMVNTIRSFQSFNSFYALTRGAGNTLGTTENLILLVYANFYEYGYWGYGAAIATMLSALILLLTLIQYRLAGRWVFFT